MATVLEKMRIKAPHVMYALNAPVEFKKGFGKLPAGISITDDPKAPFNSVHWFTTSKAEVDKQTPKVIKMLKRGTAVWCYFPKGTSRIQTDLTRDKGWDTLLATKGLKWINLISFDDTWSAFSFRLQTEADIKKEKQPAEREIFKYADSATKTIRLPDDVGNALKQHKAAEAFFNALAFTHRREYIEWIVTAKREETRKSRVQKMIELLLQQKKVR